MVRKSFVAKQFRVGRINKDTKKISFFFIKPKSQNVISFFILNVLFYFVVVWFFWFLVKRRYNKTLILMSSKTLDLVSPSKHFPLGKILTFGELCIIKTKY